MEAAPAWRRVMSRYSFPFRAGAQCGQATMDSARSVNTSTRPRERVRASPLLPLPLHRPPDAISRPSFINVLCFSPFLSPARPRRPSLRARYLRAKDVCFVNRQSWLKLPLAR